MSQPRQCGYVGRSTRPFGPALRALDWLNATARIAYIISFGENIRSLGGAVSLKEGLAYLSVHDLKQLSKHNTHTTSTVRKRFTKLHNSPLSYINASFS